MVKRCVTLLVGARDVGSAEAVAREGDVVLIEGQVPEAIRAPNNMRN